MGKEGRALTIADPEQRKQLRDIQDYANVRMDKIELNLEPFRNLDLPISDPNRGSFGGGGGRFGGGGRRGGFSRGGPSSGGPRRSFGRPGGGGFHRSSDRRGGEGGGHHREGGGERSEGHGSSGGFNKRYKRSFHR
ncbi:MAG: hypothetical protein KGH71_06100 [Candidatus Micrarchaeota archaeon]|nr:hypothetical protein [Candidatus Micrarchaeota archaeon]